MLLLIIGCVLGSSLLSCFYLLFRNKWVFELRKKMIDIVYKDIIKDGIRNGYHQYEDMPGYEFILFRKFYKWNKNYFINLMNRKLKNYDKKT